MSYGSNQYTSSSYRRIFGESPRFTGSPSRMSNVSSRSSVSSSGFRSQSVSRSSASPPAYYKRSGRSSSFSPVHFDTVDFSQASVVNNEFKIVRTNEKEQLQGLNDRFAMFIEKVRNLEQHNKVLETELVSLRQRQNEPSRLAELYQQEIRDLRAQLDEVSSEKSHILIERDSIEEDSHKLRGKFEDEIRAREEAEQTLRSYKKDVDDATMVRVDLERKLESLLDEINFLKKVHDEEVADLTSMIQAAQISVEVELSKPDLTSALKEIRGQYEVIASKNQQSAEEWYKSKFASLNEQAIKTSEAMRATREEINDYRRQLQSKTIEIETLRGTNESLERQIREMEDAHNTEVAGYQETFGQLDLELRNTKSEMAHHLREYQDLLNVKMALDIEIAAYRKLLEGEETHFSSGVHFSSAPSISYGYQSHSISTSTRNPKKEKEEETQPKSKAAAKRDENTEETAVIKKTEKSDNVDVNSN
ncbi:internexin neuronal intermediate filament protein, alpha a [Triplophysa rosa]|uniref:Alpha-internexin n=1 Tax=Triplophysa rosa TaxID=992332 RepID=A0A9W7WNE7_TRIRA|nr:internexin neuronal intermediate filament protein, alpha a [Triplophysa rosa]KAI7805431.1 alpha-internexin [Triplophysa rosa]